MPSMQSRHCCLCVTGVFATLVGLMVVSVGIAFVINNRIAYIPLTLPEEWQSDEAKEGIGIAMICLGLLSFALGILVSLCFFIPMKEICLRRLKQLREMTSARSGADGDNLEKTLDTTIGSVTSSNDKFATKKPSLILKPPPQNSKSTLMPSIVVTPQTPTGNAASTFSFPKPILSQSGPSTSGPPLSIARKGQHDFTHKDRKRYTRKSNRKNVKHSRRQPLDTHDEESEIVETELHGDNQKSRIRDRPRSNLNDRRRREILDIRQAELVSRQQKHSHTHDEAEITVVNENDQRQLHDDQYRHSTGKLISEYVPSFLHEKPNDNLLINEYNTSQNAQTLHTEDYISNIDSLEHHVHNDVPADFILVSEASEMDRSASQSSMQSLYDDISQLINVDHSVVSYTNPSFS